MLDVQLGVDLGTAYSKLVLRALGLRGGDPFLILSPNNDPLIPSLVAWDAYKIYFGAEAARVAKAPNTYVLISPKVAFAYPQSYQWGPYGLPPGLEIDDVMILLLTYLLQAGHKFGLQLADANGHDEIRLGFTLGVPTAQLATQELSQRYLAIAKAAFVLYRQFRYGELADLTGGQSLTNVHQWCGAAKQETAAKPLGDVSDWLRSEASAGLVATYYNPRIVPGQAYLELDVGAGTCSASSFLIGQEFQNQRWEKGGIGFYGAWCQPPGADVLTAAVSRGPGELGFDSRGDEAADEDLGWAPQGMPDGGVAGAFARAAFAGLREVTSIAHKRLNGYEPRQFGLFLVGGGASPSKLREMWSQHLWPAQPPTLLTIDPPADLRRFDGTRSNCVGGAASRELASRFLVAYGLAHDEAEIPLVELPDQFHVVAPPALERRINTLEGMYAV